MEIKMALRKYKEVEKIQALHLRWTKTRQANTIYMILEVTKRDKSRVARRARKFEKNKKRTKFYWNKINKLALL